MTYTSTLSTIRAAVVAKERPVVVDYDAHSPSEYASRWDLSMVAGDPADRATRTVGDDGAIHISSPLSRHGIGATVNYLALSSEWFPMPNLGSLEFSVDMRVPVPEAEGARLNAIETIAEPAGGRLADPALEYQQPALVFSMSNVQTQQSFRWFVSAGSMFAMIQRAPKNVTGMTLPATDPACIGRERVPAEIIKTAPVTAGDSHTYAIRYSREAVRTFVEYLIDGDVFSRVGQHETWLDSLGTEFTGTSPSYRQSLGNEFRDREETFVIGHGLLSPVDSIQLRHPDAPEFGVSVPITHDRLGAGGEATFVNFRVSTVVD